jgi:hypothetical protein
MSNVGRPGDKPLAEWPIGWLKLEVSSLLKNTSYLIMTQDEKLEQDLPATEAEMRTFIQDRWDADEER